MATSAGEEQNPITEERKEGNDGEEEEEEEEEEVEEEVVSGGGGSMLFSERAKMDGLLRRLSSGPVSLRVHDLLIKGNAKTRESLIKSEVLDAFRSVSTLRELILAAAAANSRLRLLDVFDSVNITLDAGPAELPNTSNVVIEIVEAKNPLTGEIAIFSKPEARFGSLEGSLKFKNLFGYGDIWDASGTYGWDKIAEISMERLLGLSIGLVSTQYHDLAYNLTWRTLTDPSCMSSKSVRRQLEHSLLSSLKYAYKIDRRDSILRPTHGYAFVSTSHIGGIGGRRFSRFVRQEFDLRGAFPLGFYNTALNIGVAAGIILPWGRGFMNSASPISDRFYMGGQSSPVCTLGRGPTTLLGFRLMRGLSPTDSQRVLRGENTDDSNSSPREDVLGGDLAVTALADLSFDLPLKLFREAGIHGHTFICAGNLSKLTEKELKGFSYQKFWESFRTSAGFGIIIPTKLFRVEINYCYILKQSEHDDSGKTGLRFSFSSPL